MPAGNKFYAAIIYELILATNSNLFWAKSSCI